MSQYHFIVNLDKKEFLHPWKLGSGFRAIEQLTTCPSTPQALFLLLLAINDNTAISMPDDEAPKQIVGRWAGDRIVAISAERNETANIQELFDSYTDISELIRPLLAYYFEGTYQQYPTSSELKEDLFPMVTKEKWYFLPPALPFDFKNPPAIKGQEEASIKAETITFYDPSDYEL